MPTIKSQRVSLSDAKVRQTAPPKAGRKFVYDAKVIGLALSVTCKGAKSFIVYCKVHNKPQRILVGKPDSMSVDEARRLAKKRIADIADGRDPLGDKRAARLSMTLGQLWEAYKSHTKARLKPSTQRTDAGRYLNCLSHWAERRLLGISHQDVVLLHQEIEQTRGPYQANRTLALLKAMFSFARRDLGLKLENPCLDIKFFPEVERERFLETDELVRFFESLAAVKDERFRDFFALALFTGARRGNLQSMRWQDIDFGNRVWHVPASDSKNRKSMNVVLSQPALEILQKRWNNRLHSVWVFPASTLAGHIVEPKFHWQSLCKRAKLHNLRLHDLRRTLGSHLAMGGASLHLVGQALGHSSQRATRVYARFERNTVRESVESAALMLAAKGGNVQA